MVMKDLGKLKPDLNLAPSSYVPNKESSFSNAPLVQMINLKVSIDKVKNILLIIIIHKEGRNLPRWPPGARSNKDKLSTKVSSTPGRLRKALSSTSETS